MSDPLSLATSLRPGTPDAVGGLRGRGTSLRAVTRTATTPRALPTVGVEESLLLDRTTGAPVPVAGFAGWCALLDDPPAGPAWTSGATVDGGARPDPVDCARVGHG